MQVRELAQQVEQLVEVTNMETKQELEDQDIDLMPRASEIALQSPPPPEPQPVLSEQGEVLLLDDDPETDVYNLAFDET